MKKPKTVNPDVDPKNVTPEPRTIHRPKLPRKEADISLVADLVAAKWMVSPAITLVWTTAEEFALKAATFGEVLGNKSAARGNRSSQAQSLKSLDRQIDTGVGRIKAAILNKWEDKEESVAQYPRYGIVKESNGYRLPADRQKRFKALQLLVSAVTKDGTGGEKRGPDFWTGIQAAYQAALADTSGTKSTESGHVADKNGLKKELMEIMTALMLVIRANYPKDYPTRYREWGWHKESY